MWVAKSSSEKTIKDLIGFKEGSYNYKMTEGFVKRSDKVINALINVKRTI
jgi:hypothetical protein